MVLVLNRRPGDAVVLKLPDKRSITVVVDRQGSNRIRVMIDAPKEIEISRKDREERNAKR